MDDARHALLLNVCISALTFSNHIYTKLKTIFAGQSKAIC